MRFFSREGNAAKIAQMDFKQYSKAEGIFHALANMGQVDINAEDYELVKDLIGPEIVVTERAGGKFYYLTKEEE